MLSKYIMTSTSYREHRCFKQRGVEKERETALPAHTKSILDHGTRIDNRQARRFGMSLLSTIRIGE